MRNLVFAAVVILLGAAATVVWAEPPATEPGKELKLDLGDKVTMKLVLIPAGKFLMGSPETEKDREMDEVQHEVTISEPFYMGITHVTVDQFAAFANDSGYKTDAEKTGWGSGFEIKDGKVDYNRGYGRSWRNPSFSQKGNHPVVQVSWNDAQAFCHWLSKKTSKTVVLPTEAQWEYACRAGTTTAYPWGDNPDDGKDWANCADHTLKAWLPNAPAYWTFFSWDDGFVFTSPVGRFKANAFGLYDMNGNALQWCSDHYGNYEKCPATDPAGPDTDNERVVRGGAWGSGPAQCRSAYRNWGNPGVKGVSDGGGFRVVVLADGPTTASADSVTGTWTFTLHIEDLAIDAVAELKQADTTITGNVIAGVDKKGLEIKDGTVTGQQIRFTVDRVSEVGTLRSKYSGKIEGDQISGKVEIGWVDVPSHPGTGAYDWVATRIKDGSKPTPGVH